MMKTIVIGAGVMGASVAYRLAQAGAAVTVLEATRDRRRHLRHQLCLDQRAQKAAEALSRSECRRHEGAFGTGRRVRRHAMVARRRQSGMGSRTRSQAQRENIEQLQSWGYAAEWITLREVEELEPDIDPATIGDAPVAFFPEEGWLDPVVYAHAMLSAARRRHGAKVICGARVVDLIMAGDRVTGVRVADGTQYEADTVVNCAGRWTNEATRDAGLHLPLAPTVGFLVFTPPVAAGLSRVVRTSIIDARPDGAGRLMLHWNPTDASLSFDTRLSPSMPEARDLVRRARQLLPSIGEVEPEAVRIAIRPIPGDHLSAIGPMPRISGYYIAITHSGVTMSPFLGAAVADEIVTWTATGGARRFPACAFL